MSRSSQYRRATGARQAPYSPLQENYASYSQGIHGAGARSYEPEQLDRLLLILTSECIGPRHPLTVAALSARVRMNGRAVRDAISNLEKSRRVLTDFSDGYYVCETADQAERATRRLESQVARMSERIKARRFMAAELVREQGQLL